MTWFISSLILLCMLAYMKESIIKINKKKEWFAVHSKNGTREFRRWVEAAECAKWNCDETDKETCIIQYNSMLSEKPVRWILRKE